jgi:hypothetical protein
MNIPRICVSLITSVIFMVIGCTPTRPEIAIEIPSFREHYPILLRKAQEWQKDAYLDDARIFLFPRSSDSGVISASFQSPSKDLEMLGVDLYQDGTITSKVFTQEYPIYQHKPITENDWKIDSQEAVEYMLEKSGQQSLSPDRNACSFIILERVLPASEQPVIWSLSLWDCWDNAQRFYIDASTAKILDSSEVNIKPTRFPTSLPPSP